MRTERAALGKAWQVQLKNKRTFMPFPGAALHSPWFSRLPRWAFGLEECGMAGRIYFFIWRVAAMRPPPVV